MHHFAYKDGALFAEDVSIERIAEEIGTPFYCYSTATLERHYRVFRAPLPEDTLVCYSVKANSNLAVIATLARQGAGADVVSLGELKRALTAGVPANKIVFSGCGKSDDELAEGLKAQIHQFNVESDQELERLSRTAEAMGTRAPVALRVNPDVDAGTHEKIATGKAENKFGISWQQARDVYARAARLPGINIVGIDVHIGSQITALTPFEKAFGQVVEMVKLLRSDGHAIDRIDLGGGLGIPYEQGNDLPPHPDEYGALINRVVGPLDAQVIFEPGRLIVGNAGILVSRVLYTKTGEARTFLILDAAMNDLIRPALYDAHHDIIPVREPRPDQTQLTYDVVGPICETGDTFARSRELPAAQPGDLVAFLSAGAYGAVQASTYNTRPLVPEILVHGNSYDVVRPRQNLDALIGQDNVPDWLAD